MVWSLLTTPFNLDSCKSFKSVNAERFFLWFDFSLTILHLIFTKQRFLWLWFLTHDHLVLYLFKCLKFMKDELIKLYNELYESTNPQFMIVVILWWSSTRTHKSLRRGSSQAGWNRCIGTVETCTRKMRSHSQKLKSKILYCLFAFQY